MPEPITFASRLTALREARGWTKYRLAKESGLTESALGKLEEGDRVPTWETVQALARALGCTPNDFSAQKEIGR